MVACHIFDRLRRSAIEGMWAGSAKQWMRLNEQFGSEARQRPKPGACRFGPSRPGLAGWLSSLISDQMVAGAVTPR
jgi:hypothetical protein